MTILAIIQLVQALAPIVAELAVKIGAPQNTADQAREYVDALIDVTGQINTASTLVRTLQAENRDPTPEEWATLDKAFGVADAQLAADIAAAT